MLINISLEDFKSFHELSDLKIQPLTILCGSNSSGKSTVLKSALTLKQSYISSSTYDTLILNGELVNNGFFEDVAFQGNAKSFTLSHSFYLQNPFGEKNRIRKKTTNIQTYKALRKLFLESKEYPKSFEINITTKFKSNNRNNLGKTPIIQEFILEIIMGTANEYTHSKIILQRIDKNNFSLEWNNVPDIQHNYISGKVPQCVAYFYGLQLSNVYINAINIPKETIITNILPNIYTLCKLAAEQYQTISYLGPLRQAPARVYSYTNETLSIGTMGEYTPFILAQNRGKKIKAMLPLLESTGLTLQNSSTTLLNATQQWLKYMNIDSISVDHNYEIVKLLVGNNNIADVGFGVSQVLPILVEGLSLLPEQTLILEQPEIHLHPSMQMCLADFLISLVKSGKQVVVETHSDHIINRIIRRIMEEDDSYLLDNTSIYFVEKADKESKIVPINIDKVHGIAECPEDFFTQYSSEVDLIVQTGFNNIRKRALNDTSN